MRQKRLATFLIIGAVMLFQTCKEPEKQMLVSTGTVSNILTTTADVSGKVLDLGEGATEFGHCYSTSPNTTISGSKTEYATPILGGFTSALSGLTPSTKYYVKAYLRRGSVAVYGEEITFTTASNDLPVLITKEITGISTEGAASGGTITTQGGTPITVKGVCWSLVTSPTINDFKTSNGTGTDNYTSILTNLAHGTKYYVRAYATNAGGTGYGNELNFTTTADAPVMPTATTSSANPVNISTATLNGIVNANGQSTTVSFEYGLTNSYGISVLGSPSPVTGTDNTNVSVAISGLSGGTLYHFRVKAENGGGVTYGLDQTFTTQCTAPTALTDPAASVTNVSAKLKGTINAHDFATTVTFEYGLTAGYGNTIPDIEGTITGSANNPVTANLTGLSPNTTYHFRVTATNCGGTVNGSDQTFTTNCTVPIAITTAATNVSVTTATLNGTVNANNFSSAVSFEYGTTTSYGASVAASPGNATGTGNTQVTADLTGLISNTVYHFRVNAVNCGGTSNGSDMTVTTLPTVTFTYYITDLTSAAFQASINAGGGAVIPARGFCWSTNQYPTVNDNKTTNGSGTGLFTGMTTSLAVNTAYYVRAYATNSSGTVYSNQFLIKTSAGTVVDVEGNLYSSVTIGTQVWMRENLRTSKYNDGTSIPLVTDNTAWGNLITEGYCWYNNDASAYKVDYGALYNRYVNTSKLCPSGWHFPALSEYIAMENNYGGMGSGGKLKEISTLHWLSPNTGATNESGFNAFPGGYRNSTGQFVYLGTYATYWTTDNYGASSGWYVYLSTNNANVTNGELSYKGGSSVRCIKD